MKHFALSTRSCKCRVVLAVAMLLGGLMMGVPAWAANVEAECKAVARAARNGDLIGLEVISQTNDPKMADTILGLVEEKRVSDECRSRMAELARNWPAAGGKDRLVDYLTRTKRSSDEMLAFFAELGLAKTEPVFRAAIAEARGKTPADFKDPARVAVAIRALGRFPQQTDAIVTYLGGCLDEKVPHVVRSSTAEALGTIRSTAALQAMAAQVQDAAIGELVQRSLYQLTGQAHGEDKNKWKEWIDAQGPLLDLKMLGLQDWESYLQAQKLVAAQPDNAQMNMATFYGVEFKARAALFILDSSGSMSGERIEKLKGQMSNLLMAMQNQAKAPRFGIVTFSDAADSCFPGNGIAETSEASIKKATKFVERITADGGTAMVSALRYAADKVLPTNIVDTIYFLSDGSPSDGTDEAVLAIVREVYAKYRVRINTIEIINVAPPPPPGVVPPPPPPVTEIPKPQTLLEKIALATGGRYVVPVGWGPAGK